MQQRNVLRLLYQARQVGFHAFRRFRLAWLRKSGAPRDLELFWMGRATEEVGELYSTLRDDATFRQEWAERVGLGFQLVHDDPQNEAKVERKNVA